MTSITLGTGERYALRLDLAKLLQGGAFVTASSGQGKSYLLRKLIEQVVAKVQVIILDPEGEFATLREKFPLLLVGQGGEVAAETRSAKLLARKLVELKLSAIIDLYSLDDWLDRRAYVAEFLSGLMNVPKKLYHPILVVIDEAHMFAPKAEGTGSKREREVTASCLRAMNVLSSAGRKRGFRNVLASQRISQIHNMAIADLKNRFIGGITLPNDQQRAADELGLTTKPERIALRDLRPGEFWAYGPALNLRGVNRFKVDTVETTHPTAGQHALSAPPPTPDAIKALAEALADLPAEAQAERDELAAAQKAVQTLDQINRTQRVRIGQLELEATRARTAVAMPVPMPIFKDGEVKALTEAVAQLSGVAKRFEESASDLTATAKGAREAAAVVQLALTTKPTAYGLPPSAKPATDKRQLAPPVPERMAGKAEAARISDELSGTGFKMTSALARALASEGDQARPPAERLNSPEPRLKLAERRILTVLLQRGPRTKRQIAVQTGYALRGGGFLNALAVLRGANYVMSQGASDLLQITEAGTQAVGELELLPTGRALLEYWCSQVKLAERSILQALNEVYPGDLSYEELATRASQLAGRPTPYVTSAGGFTNALGKLRTLELIVNSGSKRVKLSDELVDN